MDKDARSSLTTSGTESTPSHRNILHIDDGKGLITPSNGVFYHAKTHLSQAV